MPTRANGILTIAASELSAALRGRMLLGFATLFALLAVGIALAGLGASGQMVVQDFTRTAVSLMTLSLYLLPLLGLVLGATTLGGEDGGTELLLAQPVERIDVLAGRALGLFGALAVVSLAGFGVAGVLVAMGAGRAGLGGYLWVAAGATLVGWAGLALGMFLGVVVRRRSAAAGWALAAWFGAAVLYDLACIAALQVLGSGDPGGWLLLMLTLNPIDGVRALGLVTLGADVLLGPTGAALQRMLAGGTGAALVAGSVLAWTAGPLLVAGRVYRTRDF